MRPRRGLLRILIGLLILRVIAAPVTARPDPPRSADGPRFVVRVCAWPAQRAQRPTVAPQREFRSEGPGAVPAGRLSPTSRAGASGPLTGARLFGLSFRDSDLVRVHDRPRC
jgi:hypothetical protein